MVSFNSSSIYPAAHSSTTPDQQSYTGATDWPIARTSYIPSPSWQAPSNYTQMILPQGMMQVPGWNSYPVSYFAYTFENMFDDRFSYYGLAVYSLILFSNIITF